VDAALPHRLDRVPTRALADFFKSHLLAAPTGDNDLRVAPHNFLRAYYALLRTPPVVQFTKNILATGALNEFATQPMPLINGSGHSSK
jgi:hypothetical protein